MKGICSIVVRVSHVWQLMGVCIHRKSTLTLTYKSWQNIYKCQDVRVFVEKVNHKIEL